nr:hypothetical protein [Tanacetum cinerariifolium]
MATTIEQQVVLDVALVLSTQRLRIRRSNFQLPSDIQSKESTLQVVYDVLRNSPFFKAFLVTADVPEIYMQEFWAMAKLHQHSIRFKMDTRKRILDLEAFREILHISPRIPSQSFAKLPFEEEILEFLRFTKVIIDYFMMRKPSIPRRNRINWHYVRDDILFSTIKVVSRHQTTQQYVVAAPRLSAAAKGTGSRPGVPDVPSDDTEEELSWNSSDDEDVDEQTKGREESEGDKTDESDDGSDDGNYNDNNETVKASSERDEDDDDNDDEEELAKN